MPRYLARVLTAATFALLVGACAGNANTDRGVASLSDSNQPSAQQQNSDGKTDEDKQREFARCMREHGVNVPDPAPGDTGIRLEDGADPRDEKVQAAQEACKPLLPNGGEPQPMDEEQLEQAREHAKCMREHGIDMPDPDPNKPGTRIPEGVDPEKAKAATEACRMADGPGPGQGRTGSNG
jgi:hypothetical protein